MSFSSHVRAVRTVPGVTGDAYVPAAATACVVGEQSSGVLPAPVAMPQGHLVSGSVRWPAALDTQADVNIIPLQCALALISANPGVRPVQLDPPLFLATADVEAHPVPAHYSITVPVTLSTVDGLQCTFNSLTLYVVPEFGTEVLLS